MTRQAFQDTWIPLQGRFYRIAFYILEQEADAKDAVQDLYLKLWNLRDSLEMVQNPSAYGTLMLKNLCIDRIRRARPADSLEEGMVIKGPPDEELEFRENLHAVQKAMDQLPETQRKLLSLRVLQGLSYEEIAQKTGLNSLNIRVQVSLARKKIRQLV